MIEGPKDSSTLKKVLDKATNLIVEAESSHQRRRRVWIEHYKNYNSIIAKRFYMGRANLFVPLSFQLVETQVPRFLSAMWTVNPNFDISPIISTLQSEMSIEEAELRSQLRSFYAYQIEKRIRMYHKSVDFIRHMCIFGTSIAKIPFKIDQRMVRTGRQIKRNIKSVYGLSTDEKKKEDMFGNQTRTVKERDDEILIPFYNDPDFILMDLFDIFVDDLCPSHDIQEAEWIIQKSTVTWDHLMEFKQRGIYDNIPDELKGKGEAVPDSDKIDALQSTGTDVSNAVRHSGDKYTVYEIWWNDSIFGDRVDYNSVCTILEGKYVIRRERCPFWDGRKPYVSCGYARRPNEFWSNGVLDPTRRLQYELNDTRNQALDYKTLSLNAVFLVGNDADINDAQLMIRPNGVIRARDINQIRQLIFPPEILLSASTIEAQIELDARGASGSTRALQGQDLGGSRTATEFSGLLSEGSDRISHVTKELEELMLIPSLDMFHSRNRQFLKKPYVARVLKDDGPIFGDALTIDPSLLAVDVDFSAKGTLKMQQGRVQARNLIDFLTIVSKMPNTAGNQQLLTTLVKRIWAQALGFKESDIAELLLNPGTTNGNSIAGENTPQSQTPETGQEATLQESINARQEP